MTYHLDAHQHFLLTGYHRGNVNSKQISPIDHLVRLLIAHAAELLQQEQDLNITEIAFKVGFQDSNYFTRQFRRIMGRSPRKYRTHKSE